MKTVQYKKTRIAPTPSGFLHLGNILSFSVTARLAQLCDAKILLRIDDLDKPRIQPAYVEDIFSTLHFLGIPWDEGPINSSNFGEAYSQFNRMNDYENALNRLVDLGMIFACSCSRQSLLRNGKCLCYDKNIPLDAENVSWRLFTDDETGLSIRNIDGTIREACLPDDMKNFIVRKKDGYPSYQLTSVIDDLFYNIDLVVRGEDLWPSTLAQLALSFKLGEARFSEIAFFHHPLLREPTGTKMSKSEGATSVNYLRQRGMNPHQIFQQAASLAGFGGVINNWQQLGEKVIQNTLLSPL